MGRAILFVILASTVLLPASARADVVLPCPPKPERPCDDCVGLPGMPKPEHPIYQSPCWVNGNDASPADPNVPDPPANELPPLLPLSDYEGSYKLTPGTDLRIFMHDEKLYAESKYQSATILTRVSNDAFVAEAVAAYFDFERNSEGRVVAVTMDQAEKVIRAERR